MAHTDLNDIAIFYPLDGITEEDKKILEPIEHILQRSIMPMANLIHAFNYWLKVPEDKIQEIIQISHMLYVSSILIDDIQDNAEKRNGISAAHSVYGIPLTISAAHYVIFNALKRITNLHPEAPIISITKILESIKGQGIEIVWRDTFMCPSEADYKKMIEKKTSAIFDLCVTLMQLFSTCNKDFSSLITTLGLYFQIRDDYCNLYSSDYCNGFSEDLCEGKFSLAIIHALQTKSEDQKILKILKQRSNNTEVRERCIKLLEECGSLKYTRDILEQLNAKIRAEIDLLGSNPILMKILEDAEQLTRKKTLIL